MEDEGLWQETSSQFGRPNFHFFFFYVKIKKIAHISNHTHVSYL